MSGVATAILISGRGSNMRALVEAAKADGFPARIALVLSNRSDIDATIENFRSTSENLEQFSDEIRQRLGFSPTTPQQEAGMRIDPPPSEPCASGTSPAATAAAAPPEDPPAILAVSQGVTAGGAIPDSV